MNRKALIDALAEKTELTKKDADSFLTAFVETVTEELKKGEAVNMVGFGSFKVAHRDARTGRNPRTGEAVTIAAKNVPSFKVGKELKDALN